MRSRQGSTATSRRLHVATSRRGGQLLLKSTFPTSRRHHVVTSPRRDVTTSRRLLKILHLIIKCEGLGNLGHIGVCAARDTFWETCNTDLKILLGFLYWFLFICLFVWLFLDHRRMFFTLYILILSFMMF